MNQIESSLVTLLKSMAVTLSVAFSSGILVKGNSLELKDLIDDVCNIRAIDDHSLRCISQCATDVIVNVILSLNFIRDVSSLFLIKQNESSFEICAETSQFKQFASSQARSVLASAMQEMNNSLKDNRIISKIFSTTGVAIGHFGKKDSKRQLTNEWPLDKNFIERLCFLYGSVTSEPMCGLQQFVNCVSDLVQFSIRASQLSDIRTTELQNLIVKLISKSRCSTATIESKITSAVKEIEIESVITIL